MLDRDWQESLVRGRRPRWRRALPTHAPDRESTPCGDYSPVRCTGPCHRGTRDILDAPGCVDSQRHIPTVTVIDPCHPLYGRTFRELSNTPRFANPCILRSSTATASSLIAAAATDFAYCPSLCHAPKSHLASFVKFLALWLIGGSMVAPATFGDGSPKRSADPSARKS